MSHACRPFWKCDGTLTFCSLLTRCTIPRACHAKRAMNESGPNVVCFVHFDFEICFAPERCALFRHLNFQKWSDNVVLCTCSLRKCASCHNDVHFFDISTSKSGPTLRCFVHVDLEMCFAPQRRALFSSLIWPAGSAPAALASLLFECPEPQNIGKTQCFATFLPFRASASSFF